jgi:hypothetical protein
MPLPSVAVTFLGGSGMRRSIGGLRVTPPPPPPPPPIARDGEVMRKMVKTATIIAFPIMNYLLLSIFSTCIYRT